MPRARLPRPTLSFLERARLADAARRGGESRRLDPIVRRSTGVATMLTAREASQLREIARGAGKTVSDYLRDLLREQGIVS